MKHPEEEGWLRWDPSFPAWLMTDWGPPALWKPSFLWMCINVCRHNMRAHPLCYLCAGRGVCFPSLLTPQPPKKACFHHLSLAFQAQVRRYKYPWPANMARDISHTLPKCLKISKMFYSSLLLMQEQVSILWRGYLLQPNAMPGERWPENSRERRRPLLKSPPCFSGLLLLPSYPLTFNLDPSPSPVWLHGPLQFPFQLT